MPTRGAAGGLAGFWLSVLLGWLGAFAASAAVFGRASLAPGNPAFQWFAVGILGAAVMSLVRRGSSGAALGVVLGFTAAEIWAFSRHPSQAALQGLWALVLGSGFWTAALFYEELRRRGVIFGKFLVVGAVLAGFYVALTPWLTLAGARSAQLMTSLTGNALLGLVLGDGVGLGLEVAEWWSDRRRLSRGAAPSAPPTWGNHADS